jgi:hypothetical protein
LVVVVSIVEVIIGEAASERRACVGEFLSDKREREREKGGRWKMVWWWLGAR